ncbi:MAG TPA: hypothetical protein VKF84_11025 [Candidatus Sulfotelmatobacter sp.]|nr:hypothetical protein [Candidatus Sulfotelmatobacter sp.]
MLRPWLIAFAIMAPIFVAGAMFVNRIEAQTEKSTGAVAPTTAAEKTAREQKLAAATEAAKQLMLAMDTNKNGKISKEEWMKFMSDEFDRLDTNHNGELDPKELLQSRMRVRPAVGK